MALRREICMPSWLLWRLVVGFSTMRRSFEVGCGVYRTGKGRTGRIGCEGCLLKGNAPAEVWHCVHRDRHLANIHHSLISESFRYMHPPVLQGMLPVCDERIH
jgi:hypothetical protein